jgi:hypothetical protein
MLKRGVAAIARVRAERPDVYLRVVASILPKHLELENVSLTGLATTNSPLSSPTSETL